MITGTLIRFSEIAIDAIAISASRSVRDKAWRTVLAMIGCQMALACFIRPREIMVAARRCCQRRVNKRGQLRQAITACATRKHYRDKQILRLQFSCSAVSKCVCHSFLCIHE